ncbi:MAG: hypothetical protein J6Q82_07550 [Clostridia bacterium]|nr:hypothetical protein [Clostridia bacterium]
MKESLFYKIASTALFQEENRLDSFCKTLDQSPEEKKAKIAEYKCAKFRHATVCRIYMLLYHGNRVYQMSAIHVDIENKLKERTEYFSLVENASTDEKIDFKLYYGISAIAEELLVQSQKKLETANDWEKIELEERIGGLQFAKACLDEAWERRKEVIQ